jgi:fengycin family lipopeptide synthetase D
MGDAPGIKHLVFTENDLNLGQSSDNYYISTKFMAEQEILAARELGIHTSIYRIGNISVNSVSGKCQQDVGTNAFFRQLRSFIKLGAVPTQYDEVEFSFVDCVAKAILKLYDREALANETFHLANTNVTKLSDILPCLYPKHHVNTMEFVPFVDFLCEMVENTEKSHDVKEVILQRGWFAMTGLAEDDAFNGMVPFTVLYNKTLDLLERRGFKWPAPEWEVLKELVLTAAE